MMNKDCERTTVVYGQFPDLRDDAPDMHISRPTWIVDVSETRSREDILRQHKLKLLSASHTYQRMVPTSSDLIYRRDLSRLTLGGTLRWILALALTPRMIFVQVSHA